MKSIKEFLNSKSVTSDVGEETILTWRETISYALGRAAQGMSTSAMTSDTVNYFLTNLMSLKLDLVSNIRLWAGLWDAFNDPIMGVIVDKTHTKDGKMRPYIKVAPFICAAFTAMTFFNSPSFPSWLRILFAIVALVGWDMSYTAFDIPMGALAFSITPSSVERTKLFGVSSIARAIGGGIAGAVIPIAVLFEALKTHIRGAYMLSGVIAFIGIILLSRPTYYNTKERAHHSEEEPTIGQCFRLLLKNKPLFMLFLSNMAFLLVTTKTAADMYFAIDLVGSSAMYTILKVAAAPAPFLAGILVPIIVQKLGKHADFKKMYIICCLIAAGIHGLMYLVGEPSLMNLQTGKNPSIGFLIVIAALILLSNIPLEFKNLLGKEMEAETVDYVEWKTGDRAEGIMLSLMSFTGKLTNSVSSTIALAILGAANYATHSNVVAVAQTHSAKFALLSLQTLVPMAGYLLMLVPIIFYSITRKQHDQMMREIRERRAALDQ